MKRYKFKKSHIDSDMQEIQREIEDNLATQNDVNDKYNKVKEIKKSAPKANDLSDGDTRVYDDGTNVYRYYKVGSRLFRQTLTEV